MTLMHKPRFIGGYIRRKHFEKIVNLLEFTFVLDAGCGGGEYSLFIAREFKSVRVVGYDVNGAQMRKNKAIVQKKNLTNVKFFAKDLASMNDFERFDLIICVDVLEHIENDERCIHAFYQALKPGGKLYIHVPGLLQFRHFNKSKEIEPEKTHIREGYSINQMKGLLAENRFKSIQVGKTFGTYGTLAWEIYMLTRKSAIIHHLLSPLFLFLAWMDVQSRNNKHNNFYVLAEKGLKISE